MKEKKMHSKSIVKLNKLQITASSHMLMRIRESFLWIEEWALVVVNLDLKIFALERNKKKFRDIQTEAEWKLTSFLILYSEVHVAVAQM